MHVKFSIRQTILIGQYVFMTLMLILILVFATKFKFNLFVQAYCARLAQSVEHETSQGRGFEPHVGCWYFFVTCFKTLSVCIALH